MFKHQQKVRSDVNRWVMRLIDYGKGAVDPELDKLTVGQISDEIIALVKKGE